MISFDNFILEDGMPIYLQILLFLKRGVIAGGCLAARVPMARRSGTRPYEALLPVCAEAAMLSREMGDGSSAWPVCICAALTLGCTPLRAANMC